MAIFKDKTGRGEADYAKSPVQGSDGTILYLNDHTGNTPNVYAYDGGLQTNHLVFQLRGESSGVKDVSDNNFLITESSSLTKRMEDVNHTKRLKTFEFSDGKTISLTPKVQEKYQNPGSSSGAPELGRDQSHGSSPIETIIPVSVTGTRIGDGGSAEVIISFWIYVNQYGSGANGGGSCIMEQVSGTARTFGVILSSAGELVFRWYDWGTDSTNAVDFQQIMTQEKLNLKKWYHVTIFAKGGAAALDDDNYAYNTNGLDSTHQDHSTGASGLSPFGLPQVAIFINGQEQINPSESGLTSGNFTGTLSSDPLFPVVLGTGLAGYDNLGPEFQSGADANFIGKLAEVSYFYTNRLARQLNSLSSNNSNYRSVIANTLMTGGKQPTSGITNVSERLLLRDLDQSSTHPTVKRSGDQRRLGNHLIQFDDSRAQTLKGATVHYPTKLVKGDNLIDTIYDGYFNGDLTLSHTASVESYDTFYRREDQPAHEPFVESRVYIDSGSSFYQTGTLESVLPGFSGPLSQKECITFNLGDAKIALENIDGTTITTGSEYTKRNDFEQTIHVPSMYYYDSNSKSFNALSSKDGNFGGIKNASNHASVIAASGTIETQVNNILNEMRLGFAPFEGQPFLFSEQVESPSEFGLSYSEASGINNMKDGVLPKHTGSFTAMPNNGDVMAMTSNISPTTGLGLFTYTINFDNSSTTDTTFSSFSATLGLSGLTLDTLVPKISTLIDSLSQTSVSSYLADGSNSKIRWNGTLASPTSRNFQLDPNSNTWAGWSLESTRGKAEVSALQFAGSGLSLNIAEPITDFGFPYSSKYHQDSNSAVKMSDYISEPFLAEKIVVTFEAEASAGFSLQGQYYVYTVEAPTKYVPRYIRPVGGTTADAKATLDAGYPPPNVDDAYVPESPVGQNTSPSTIIQYDINDDGDGFHFFESATSQAGLSGKTSFHDYHFFVLKQNKKSRSNMSLERKGNSEIIAYDQTTSNASFAEGLDGQREKDSDITNRELIHHSKLLVFTQNQGYSGLSDDRYEERQDLILSNTTSSFDALLPVQGDTSQSITNRHDLGSNFSPLFDLPYTGSSSQFGDSFTIRNYNENFAKTVITSSVSIEKTFGAKKKHSKSSNLFLPAHPSDATQTKTSFTPGSMLRLSNTMGGYHQTEEFGTRALGPGNINSLDGSSETYVSVNNFKEITSDAVTENHITSSISVKKANDPGSAPIVLFPEDELIFGWQNAINANSILNPSRYTVRSEDGLNYSSIGISHPGLRLVTSNIVKEFPKLKVKNLKVSLFGSFLRNSQPRQFQLNQLLNNDIVHESIGQEPISDQFDIEPRGAFTGSYVDEVMSGSTIAPYNGYEHFSETTTNLARRIAGRSSEGTQGVTGSLRRTLSIASADKTEYDSFLFDLESMFAIDERSQNVPNNGKFGFPGNYIDDFETGSNKVDTLLLGSDPSLIGNVDDYNKNVVANVDIGASFLNARYSSVTKVRQSQIGAGAGLFNIAVTGSYNVPGLVDLITGDESYIGSRYFVNKDTELSNLRAQEVAKVIFAIGEGTQNAHRSIKSSGAGIIINDIRGFRYGLSNIGNKKPKNVFRRDRYGQLRDMLEMAPNTAYIDDISNTISYPIEAQFFADDGSTITPDATSCSNLSTYVTSSAPFFDREVVEFNDPLVVRNRGPLNNKVADITIEI